MVGVAVATTLTLPASAQSLRWDMDNEYSEKLPYVDGDRMFERSVEERSGGEIEITRTRRRWWCLLSLNITIAI